jgi:hypothetical protein
MKLGEHVPKAFKNSSFFAGLSFFQARLIDVTCPCVAAKNPVQTQPYAVTLEFHPT